jgi:hypothetical protein
MKKSIFILIMVLVTLSNSVFSQHCIPDPSITSPGIYPDFETNLPHAMVDEYYEAIISTMIPTDTSIGFTVTIDSIGVKKIIGLPDNLAWVTDSPFNYWKGGSKGCLKISGTPIQEGTFNLQIVLDMHGKFAGMPLSLADTVTGYKIIVGPAGIEFLYNAISHIETYPNPVSNSFNIDIHTSVPSDISVTIYNNFGVIVQENVFSVLQGKHTLPIFFKNRLSDGIYFIQISSEFQSVTRKLLIQN